MKKIAILCSAFLFSVSAIYAATPKTGEDLSMLPKKGHNMGAMPSKRSERIGINSRSESNFINDFGNVPATKWERSTNYDEVVFTKDGKKYTGYYDSEGNLVGTTNSVKLSDLPKKAQKQIQTKYKDYTIENVIFFDENKANSNDMYFYGKQFESADNYFVELTKGTKRMILQVPPEGEVYFFTEF